MHTSLLDLLEQAPVLDLESLPDDSGVVDGVLNQLSLLADLQVDVLLVVLALDVRHVDGDQDVRVLGLQPHQVQHDGCEVRRQRLGVWVRRWRLCGDQRVRRRVFPAPCVSM
jgi:hypothetical protein